MQIIDSETRFNEEQAQVEKDHHTPTAGAMTDHILSNLAIQRVKLYQSKWYVTGPQSIELRKMLESLIGDFNSHYDQLGELLRDEEQFPSSMTSQYQKYSMLEENGAHKYASAEEMIEEIVQDFETSNMFIDRAIKLADKEERPALAQWLVSLRGYNNHQVRYLVGFQGELAPAKEDEDFD